MSLPGGRPKGQVRSKSSRSTKFPNEHTPLGGTYEEPDRAMRAKEPVRHDIGGEHCRAQVVADDEEVKHFPAARRVAGSVDDPSHQLKEASGGKLVGLAVEVTRQHPWTSNAAEAHGQGCRCSTGAKGQFYQEGESTQHGDRLRIRLQFSALARGGAGREL